MYNKYSFDLAGMTNLEGFLKGFVSEEIDIYVPPEHLVLLDLDEYHGKLASLNFPVPQNWAKNNKSGTAAELERFGWKKRDKTTNLLDEFASLADAKTERYLAFARKWGPLWYQILPYELDALDSYFEPWVEHLFLWNALAKEVKILLHIASMLRQNKEAGYSLWKSIMPGADKVYYETIENQRELLAKYINSRGENMTDPSHKEHSPTDYFIRLHIDWNKEDPELRIYTKIGFYSAVWLQLLQAVTASNICVCSGCSRVYVRDRKPPKSRNNFCENCRDKTNKASKRLYAQKKRKG